MEGPQPAAAPMMRGAASPDEKKIFKSIMESLIGTRGAEILDSKLKVLGKVPMSELSATLKSVGTGVHAVIVDGEIDQDLVQASESSNVRYLVGMESKVRPDQSRVQILTVSEL